MSLMTLTEKSRTRSYGLLSSRVSQVLTNIVQSRSLPDEENTHILTQGKDLLDKFILGSRLIEGDDFKDGLIPTPESLTAFPYAVTTLKALEKLRDDERVSKILNTIRAFLEKAINLKSIEELKQDEIDILREFFTTLATLFYNDLVQQRLQRSAMPSSKSELTDSNGKFGLRVNR